MKKKNDFKAFCGLHYEEKVSNLNNLMASVLATAFKEFLFQVFAVLLTSRGPLLQWLIFLE